MDRSQDGSQPCGMPRVLRDASQSIRKDVSNAGTLPLSPAFVAVDQEGRVECGGRTVRPASMPAERVAVDQEGRVECG